MHDAEFYNFSNPSRNSHIVNLGKRNETPFVSNIFYVCAIIDVTENPRN